MSVPALKNYHANQNNKSKSASLQMVVDDHYERTRIKNDASLILNAG